MDIIASVNPIQRPAFLAYNGNYILYMLCPRAIINLSGGLPYGILEYKRPCIFLAPDTQNVYILLTIFSFLFTHCGIMPP